MQLQKWAVLLAPVYASINCEAQGLQQYNQLYTFEQTSSTPPTNTVLKLYFNPCGPIKVDGCAADESLCVVNEIITSDNQRVVSSIRGYGSESSGAKWTAYPDDGLDITMDGAKWGERYLSARVNIHCGMLSNQVSDGLDHIDVQIGSGALCPNDPDNKNPGGSNPGTPKAPSEKKGGWGFFHWVFVLLIIGGILYALLTVYVNIAQSRGTLPLAADMGDVLRELPYLFKDLVRKVKGAFSSSSRTGYAAI